MLLPEIPALPAPLRDNANHARLMEEFAARRQELLKQRPELRGKALRCPCCASDLARFDPFRHKPHHPWRENAKCPVCGAMERHRRLWLRLLQTPELFAGAASMLHIAPEPFLRAVFSGCGNLEYLDCDLLEERAGQRVDITALPFDTGRFDWIICSHVLEHVADDRAALSELHRVLKSGGTAFILVPTLKGGTVHHTPPAGGFSPDDHVRDYGLEDFLERLTQAGFTVRLEPAREIPPFWKQGFRLSNNIYVCSRRQDFQGAA